MGKENLWTCGSLSPFCCRNLKFFCTCSWTFCVALNITPVGVRFVQYLILNTCMMLYITLQYMTCSAVSTLSVLLQGDCVKFVIQSPWRVDSHIFDAQQPPVVHSKYSTVFFNLHTPGRLHMCCSVNRVLQQRQSTSEWCLDRYAAQVPPEWKQIRLFPILGPGIMA